jgi:hypothetical protein
MLILLHRHHSIKLPTLAPLRKDVALAVAGIVVVAVAEDVDVDNTTNSRIMCSSSRTMDSSRRATNSSRGHQTTKSIIETGTIAGLMATT